jgi:hypothetical protein
MGVKRGKELTENKVSLTALGFRHDSLGQAQEIAMADI